MTPTPPCRPPVHREARRRERALLRRVGRAVREYRMMAPGDRVAVAVSGGMDSLVLLHLLARMQERWGPEGLHLVAVHVDMGLPDAPTEHVVAVLAATGLPYRVVRQDIWSQVQARIGRDRPLCALCSRLRRGVLWRVAREEGAQRLATGHHRDDFVETLLLNTFYAGKLAAMAPRLRAEDGLTLVRPLLRCPQALIREFGESLVLPPMPAHPCGPRENPERRRVRQLLADLERHNPRVPGSILAACANVQPGHLLDVGLWEGGVGEE